MYKLIICLLFLAGCSSDKNSCKVALEPISGMPLTEPCKDFQIQVGGSLWVKNCFSGVEYLLTSNVMLVDLSKDKDQEEYEFCFGE